MFPKEQVANKETLKGVNMSRGAGRVQRIIEEAFSVPEKSYTLLDLFRYAYPEAEDLEKKHQVAIKRAAAKVCLKTGWKTWRRDTRGRGYVYYDPCDLISYATARLKADERNYQSQDWWIREFNPKTDEDILASLAEGGRHHKLIVEGGTWWRFVQIAIAERDGDEDTFRKLKGEADAEFEAWANAFSNAFKR